MRAADHLIQTLAQLGTKHIFSLSGNQIMPIYDAWIDSDINLIHTRHEAGAIHMADAWGRLTGQPGVALIAGGPGFANALSAMYVAKMAESPIVVLSGHVSLSQLGLGAFQEMPQAEMAQPVSKASWMSTHADHIATDVRNAFRIAQAGRPGPVHLSLPFDLLSQPVDLGRAHAAPSRSPLPKLEAAEVIAIRDAIGRAKRPLVLAGSAVMRSAEFPPLQTALSAVNLPLIGTESPRGVNDPSLGAFGDVLAEADLILLIGKKLDFTLRFGQAPFIQAGTTLIQIDINAAAIDLTRHNGATLDLRHLIQADPIDALARLAQAMATTMLDSAWAADVAAALAYVPPAWSQLKSERGAALHSAEVGQTIHNYLAGAEESVLISDGGEFGQWMQALIKPPHRIINGLSGSIGNAVPFGLAARLAFPNSRIVACSGDGAFGFQPFEIETAVRHKLPFTTVIGNDALWNAEYQIQLRTYGPDRLKGVTLNHTNYHEAVQALGGWGTQVTDIDALETALHDAHGAQLPACINTTIQGEAAPIIRRQ